MGKRGFWARMSFPKMVATISPPCLHVLNGALPLSHQDVELNSLAFVILGSTYMWKSCLPGSKVMNHHSFHLWLEALSYHERVLRLWAAMLWGSAIQPPWDHKEILQGDVKRKIPQLLLPPAALALATTWLHWMTAPKSEPSRCESFPNSWSTETRRK